MVSMRILLIILIVFICVEAHREYHRIHVPTRIKTIYHTKIIKVPEHHHYIHEKEKLVPVVSHHHHSSHHKSSSYTDVNVEESALEYHQAPDSYHPLDEDDFDLDSYKIASDYLPSYKKTAKINHKRKKLRPLRVKHKIVKLPPI